jgi:hypothetical protein
MRFYPSSRRTGLLSAFAAVVIAASAAWAGAPHFVNNSVKAVLSGNSVIVTGKEAGLGDELQVQVQASVQAACVNRGQNFPQAANKQTFTVSSQFPVQNGQAQFSLTLTPTFQPKCSPPMTVVFGPTVTVTDLTNNISTTVPLSQ